MLESCRLPLLSIQNACLAGFALACLSGCDSTSYSSSIGAAAVAAAPGGTGSTTQAPGFNGPAVVSGAHDSVVATPSATMISVAVGAARAISITFASSDARVMTGFSISAAAGGMPAGWSGPGGFTCANLSTGSGCVMNLQYAPSAVDSGTLTVNYVVVDNAGLAKTDGAVSIEYSATPNNNVIATVSPAGEIDAATGAGTVPVIVNFTTDDGNPATNLTVATDLTSLPAGWAAGGSALTCPIITTGSGCELALTYAAAGGSGVLTLNYDYTDDSGANKSASLNIPYRTSTANNVVATTSPSGEIVAAQKTGRQAVAIAFRSDDGRPATGLMVTSNLAALPPGWSSASHSFSCGSVSTENGCQLDLEYAPAALTNGTLSLNYSYTDGSGMTKNGLLNVAYAATTNDNVVGAPSPAGQINAVVGSATQAVAVTFSTDDGRAATALNVTSDLAALPPGWSSSAATFACSALDHDSACILPLSYTPGAAANGAMALSFSYQNNAGESKSGTVNIAYRATTNDTVVATPSTPSLSVAVASTTSVSVSFVTNDGNPASQLSLSTALATLPAGWSAASPGFSCATLSAGTACVLSLEYAPAAPAAGTLVLDFGYINDSGIANTGTVNIAYDAS